MLLLSPVVGAVLFCHFIYRPVHDNLCNVVYILGRTSNTSKTSSYLQVESRAAVVFRHSLLAPSMQAGTFFLSFKEIPLVSCLLLAWLLCQSYCRHDRQLALCSWQLMGNLNNLRSSIHLLVAIERMWTVCKCTFWTSLWSESYSHSCGLMKRQISMLGEGTTLLLYTHWILNIHTRLAPWAWRACNNIMHRIAYIAGVIWNALKVPKY